ncbi:MAG: hypothetical protein H5T96_06130 [Tissierellales bacterium]|nr:hypothetical protein [Tissierellales bacterium]
MKVFFIRTELSDSDKECILIKLREPVEFAYLAGNLRDYIKDKCEMKLIDSAVTKENLKKDLLDEEPSLVLFQGYHGQENTINEVSNLTKNILPKTIIAVIGDLNRSEKLPFVDLYFNVNPIEQFNETILGIEVDRSLDEIKTKVDSIGIKGETNINLPDRSVYTNENEYYFLNFKSTIEVFTIFRDNIYEKGLIGKKNGKFYDIKDISMQIETTRADGIYFKDFDVFENEYRLNEIINLITEKNYNKKYFAVGNWDTIKRNEELINKFAKLGLKSLILYFEFPKDEEKWILMGEVFDILNKYSIESIIYLDTELNKEEEETLVFWLKERKQALIYLSGEALKKNNTIYKKLPLNFSQWSRWTKTVGFNETQRRRNYYKKYVV